MASRGFQFLRFLIAGCAGQYVVQDVRLRASTSFNPDYSVSTYSLREVSGCGFSGTDLESLFLVTGDGHLFAASMVVGDKKMEISFKDALELIPPGPDFNVVKAGGCTFDSNNNFYVSTEKNNENPNEVSALAILEYNTSTGKSKPRESEFVVPPYVAQRAFDDLGFESLTASKALGGNVEYLLSTTADSIDLQDPGVFSILAWNIETGGSPTFAFPYDSAQDEDGTSYNVVEFESLESTILVLERLFLDPGYMVRLFEVEVDPVENQTSKQEVYNWTQHTLVSRMGKSFEVETHNFAGMCLLPSSSTLLLVNDNLNSQDEGTFFVLVDLIVDGLDPYPSSTSSKKKKQEDNLVWLWVSLAVAFLLVVCICGCFRPRKRQESHPGIPTPHASYTDEDHIELNYTDKPTQNYGDRDDNDYTDAGPANLDKEPRPYV